MLEDGLIYGSSPTVTSYLFHCSCQRELRRSLQANPAFGQGNLTHGLVVDPWVGLWLVCVLLFKGIGKDTVENLHGESDFGKRTATVAVAS